MNELIKSTDYNRLANLIEQGARLPVGYIKDKKDIWFGYAEYSHPKYDGAFYHYGIENWGFHKGAYAASIDQSIARSAFISECGTSDIFFIDPASQQNQQTFDCIPNMSLEDALKHIPGGAQIDMEERFVESIAWECNGEPMHECWSENETPMDAILRLYARAKRAECGIEKTPAELAAVEMVEALAQMCEMWQSMAGQIPPLANERKYLNALEVLKKARGEE